MNTRRKLEILADAAKYDASCASGGSRRAAKPGGIGATEGMGICHSYTPDGRCVSLLKILFTNYCIYDCRYCTSRISSDVERARFSIEEVVQLTLDFYRGNFIEGLFLSSGVLKSPDYTMEQLIAVARMLREQHRFGGYIHLKSAPGVAQELLQEAGRWADRLSVNVELPTRADLAQLAPEKSMEAVEDSMAKIADAKAQAESARSYAPAGQSTQIIVGASPATDAEILITSNPFIPKLSVAACVLLGVQSDPACRSALAHGGPAARARAPLVSGRLADPILWFRGRRAGE
jgi:putative DNA modification/repair radical SAM protein